MSNKQLSVCVSQDKDNYNANNKDIHLRNCSKGILTLGTIALLKRDCPFANRHIRIITEAAEDNAGICSFTQKLHYLFINKMRT